MPTRAEFLLFAEHWCEMVEAETEALRAQLLLVTAEKDAAIAAVQKARDQAIAERDEARHALAQAMRAAVVASMSSQALTRQCLRCPQVFSLPHRYSEATLCPDCRSQAARENIQAVNERNAPKGTEPSAT